MMYVQGTLYIIIIIIVIIVIIIVIIIALQTDSNMSVLTPELLDLDEGTEREDGSGTNAICNPVQSIKS